MAAVGGLLELALLSAVARAGRYRYCYFFALYIAAEFSVTISAFLSTAVYQDWGAWSLARYFCTLMRLALVAEIFLLVFRALPRARFRAVTLLSGAAVILAIALTMPYGTRNAYEVALELNTRFTYPMVWTLIALLGLVTWHRVPLHHFHKVLLHGMLWLLIAEIGALRALSLPHGQTVWLAAGLIKAGVYLVWLRAAWSTDRPAGAEEAAVIRYLQPWRAQ